MNIGNEEDFWWIMKRINETRKEKGGKKICGIRKLKISLTNQVL